MKVLLHLGKKSSVVSHASQTRWEHHINEPLHSTGQQQRKDCDSNPGEFLLTRPQGI